MSFLKDSIVATTGVLAAGAAVALFYAHYLYRKDTDQKRKAREKRKALQAARQESESEDVTFSMAGTESKSRTEAKSGSGISTSSATVTEEKKGGVTIPAMTRTASGSGSVPTNRRPASLLKMKTPVEQMLSKPYVESEFLKMIEASIAHLNQSGDHGGDNEVYIYRRIRQLESGLVGTGSSNHVSGSVNAVTRPSTGAGSNHMLRQSPQLRSSCAKWLSAYNSVKYGDGLTSELPKTYMDDLRKILAWSDLTPDEEKSLSLADQISHASLRMDVAGQLEDKDALKKSFDTLSSFDNLTSDEYVVLFPSAAFLGKWTKVKEYAKQFESNPEALFSFHHAALTTPAVPDMKVLNDMQQAGMPYMQNDVDESELIWDKLHIVQLDMYLKDLRADDPEVSSKMDPAPLRTAKVPKVFKRGDRVLRRRGAILQMDSFAPPIPNHPPSQAVGIHAGAGKRMYLSTYRAILAQRQRVEHTEKYNFTQIGQETVDGKSIWIGEYRSTNEPVTDEEGNPRGTDSPPEGVTFVFTVVMITQREMSEEELNARRAGMPSSNAHSNTFYKELPKNIPHAKDVCEGKFDEKAWERKNKNLIVKIGPSSNEPEDEEEFDPLAALTGAVDDLEDTLEESEEIKHVPSVDTNENTLVNVTEDELDKSLKEVEKQLEISLNRPLSSGESNNEEDQVRESIAVSESKAPTTSQPSSQVNETVPSFDDIMDDVNRATSTDTEDRVVESTTEADSTTTSSVAPPSTVDFESNIDVPNPTTATSTTESSSAATVTAEEVD